MQGPSEQGRGDWCETSYLSEQGQQRERDWSEWVLRSEQDLRAMDESSLGTQPDLWEDLSEEGGAGFH